MKQQPERVTAFFYCAAQMNDTTLYLDNQMHQQMKCDLRSVLCTTKKGGEQI